MSDEELKERERIRYQWMLNRIQAFKVLVLTIALAMTAYSINAIEATTSLVSLSIVSFSCVCLLASIVLAGLDTGGAVFYNEASQEGISKRKRMLLYVLMLVAATLLFVSKVVDAWCRLNIPNT
ncbi:MULTISPECIES: hypothetical protein [Vibrio harveyi group]|uniref:hypothetical protein n=1 Tax=Vibrio harveyi group TaxID=717610 RepID=UPI00084A5DFC|nr:hypothetical protein [Vibrio parahaemolyticus]EGQ7787760.1 hypothetical protein [Vibrio cholerae]EKF9835772.1 hypothetical protein [Vibrio cholerae]EKF9846803.1 hypothetical protein [Vibrio cholerae]EKO4195236.1 hypothetical protein [Vibrio cholerae]ODX21583.1 hypothetical protein BBM91_13355 [Vibrio parahaemolyticus]